MVSFFLNDDTTKSSFWIFDAAIDKKLPCIQQGKFFDVSILSSNDFNIDPDLIEKVYGIPRDYVSVLNQKETALLSQFTEYSEESECCVAHLDSLSSLVAGFCGAESARRAEDVCSIIQTVSVIIGAVLAVMFTYAQTIMHLPLASMMLLGFGFMGLAMLTAVAKNYD